MGQFYTPDDSGFSNSYGYNANGEQTSRTLSGTGNTLAYDYDGQLTSITSGGATTSFQYDALGRRISRTSGGVTTQFLSNPADGQVWLEAVGGTITATYTWGVGLIRKDGEYPLFDGLGSERTVTNSSQTVTGSINYDAFGQSVGSTGSSSDPYMFAATSGYRNDGDAGLSLVGARYYDAQAGRFITRDTELDQAPYAYCVHDPVNAVDPSGHGVSIFGFKVTWGQIGGAVGGVIGSVIEPGGGTAIGVGVGRFFGGLFDGESPGTAAKAGLVSGAISYVGGVVLKPIVGGIVGKLFPEPVIAPVTRSPVWRMKDGGRFF